MYKTSKVCSDQRRDGASVEQACDDKGLASTPDWIPERSCQVLVGTAM
jgi:hypothetical protein